MPAVLRNRSTTTRPQGLSRLAAFAGEVGSLFARRRDSRVIASLRAELAAQAGVIRAQQASLEHTQKIFERASAAARIGVWECELPSETLRWTDVVYDIFDLPRGVALRREEIVLCYAEESRRTLTAMRNRAIAERSGFTLDAEITTFRGNHRWIRITASVESEGPSAVRIFGMKQDITQEKLLSDRTRWLAEFDVMTGLANRAQFQARLAGSADGEPVHALMLVDLDGFKQVNDTHGHALGDVCIKEAAQRLAAVCQGAELVARIGGDEFAVLLGRGRPVEGLAREVVHAMAQPIEASGLSLRIGASVGIAYAAGCTPSDLFKRADIALYAAKGSGRNTFRVFP